MQGQAQDALIVLEKRGLHVSDEVRERILGRGDAGLVRRWFDRAITVERAEDVFGDD